MSYVRFLSTLILIFLFSACSFINELSEKINRKDKKQYELFQLHMAHEKEIRSYHEEIETLERKIEELEYKLEDYEAVSYNRQETSRQAEQELKARRDNSQNSSISNRELNKLYNKIEKLEKSLTQKDAALTQKELAIQRILSKASNLGMDIETSTADYSCFVADLNTADLHLYWKNSEGVPFRTINRLNYQLSKDDHELIFATNAGMFTPAFAPKGLYIERTRMLRPLDAKREGYGNFYLQPNGVFAVNEQNEARIMPTQDFLAYHQKNEVEFATQSGPMLLINGEVHTAFTEGSRNLRIRSGVGILPNGKAVFIISNIPVNFYDFAIFFKSYFGCKDALYLDGSISQMYAPSMSRFEKEGKFGAIIGITTK